MPYAVEELLAERAVAVGTQAVALARLATASAVMRRLGADCIQVSIRQGPISIVTEHLNRDRAVHRAHGAGLPVDGWTINDEERSTNFSTSG